MTENPYLKQLAQNINANLTHLNKGVGQLQSLPNQFRQAALTKVNEVISQLQFPTGHKLDVKLNHQQKTQIQNVNQVEVRLQQDTLSIQPVSKNILRQTLMSQQINSLSQQASESFEPNQNKGQLVKAQVTQSNELKFLFEGKNYQTSLPKALTTLKNVFLIVRPENNAISIQFVNSSEPLRQLATQLTGVQSKEGFSIDNQIFTPIKSLQTGQYQVSVQDGKAIFKSKSGAQTQILLTELSRKLADYLTRATTAQAGQYLIKTVEVSANQVKLNLAGHEMSLPLSKPVEAKLAQSDKPSSVLSTTPPPAQGIQLANLKITGNTAALALSDGQQLKFELPVQQLIQSHFSQLSAEPKKLVQFLQNNQLITAKQAQVLAMASGSLKAEISADKPSGLKLQIFEQAHKPIEVKISADLKSQLVTNKLFQLDNIDNLTDKSLLAKTGQSNQLISAEGLLKQLNQTSQVNTVTASIVQQLKQLSHQHSQPALAPNLQTLLELSQQNKTELPPALTQVLNQLKQPVSDESLSKQIQSQIQLPAILAGLPALNQPQSAGLAGQLIQALQLLFTAKAKAGLNSPTTRENKPTQAKPTANTASGNLNQTTQDKQLSSLANSVKHFQLNQLKSAEQQSQGNNQIFASIPFNFNGEITDIELSLQCEPEEVNEEDKASIKLWKFSLKFNLDDLGKLLIKAVLIEDKLKLNLYCENDKLNELAQQKLSWLQQRLTGLNIQLEQTGFNLGKIPQHLWQESAIRSQYRL